MQDLKYWQVINTALHEEMERDETVTIAGEDVASVGGPFGASRGLLEKFGPQRVRDTPISELAMVGLGVGAAMAGMRPVIEIMFSDFLALSMDQLVNQAAKVSFMSQGRLKVPLTIRTLCGSGRTTSSQHVQSLEAWTSHVPGLKVVWPATPADAKGLLKSAIRDNNPVIVIESLSLWTERGPVPEGEHLVPIGKADIKRPGRDVTIVTAGGMVPRVLKAAEILSGEGIDAEVIDLRTLSPIDEETVLESLSRTHRIAVVHEAVKHYGFGAEIAAIVAEKGIYDLETPIKRIAAPWAPLASASSLAREYLPSVDKIVQGVKSIF